jgi:hypothetical protein
MGKASTVIYFSPKLITVCSGSFGPSKKDAKVNEITVFKKASAPIEEGVVVNGVINDEDKLIAALEQVTAEYGPIKDAVLVLDTTHIVYKLSVLPAVNKKETMLLIKNEFVNRNMSNAEYIYDYSVIDAPHLQKNQRMIMACAIDKTIIETYKAFFKRTSITLSSIDFSANIVLQAMASLKNPLMRHKEGNNAILCIIDHYIVFILHFLANGEVSFLRSRILSAENDPGYFSEIGDVLHSYLQSRKSVNRAEETDTICVIDNNKVLASAENYMTGSTGFNISYAGIANIMAIKGIDVEEKDKFAYGLFAIAGEAKKPLNFLSIREHKAMSKRAKMTIILSVIGTVVVGSVAGSLVILHMTVNEMNRQIDENRAYTLNAENRAAINLFDTSERELEDLAAAIGVLTNYENTVGETAVLERGVVEQVFQLFRQVDVNSAISRVTFNSERSSMTFDGFSSDPLLVSTIVEELRNSDIFRDIVYSRYNVGRSPTGLDGYIFSVECFVKEVKSVE